MKRMNEIIKQVGALGLFLLLLSVGVVLAQSEGDWSEPINLSLSGAASEPHLVTDNTGLVHVFWQDQFSGNTYVRGQGTNWSSPVAVQLPVTNTVPLMVADEAGQIHAFWQVYNQVADVTVLQYGRAPAGNITTPTAWTPPQDLSTNIITWDVLAGTNGQLHLSLIRLTPSGASLDYRQSNDGGNTWSDPQTIYESAYLRLMNNNHISLELIEADTNTLLIAWEDEAREQVFTARSNNSGQSWTAAQVIDEREITDNPAAIGPRDLHVTRSGDLLHLVWQAGHESANCSQYHQVSADGGNTWDVRRPILTEIRECLDTLHLFASGDSVLLGGQAQTGVFFSAWRGASWSDLQRQAVLSGFSDGLTSRQVTLDCVLDFAVQGDALVVAGCGTSLGQDVWLAQRSLSTFATALIEPPIWDVPIPVVTNAGLVLEPVVVADGQGGVHVLWSEGDPAGNTFTLPEGNTTLYSQLTDNRWTEPLRLFDFPSIQADQLAVAVSPSDRLLVVWRERAQGDISFTWANASRATLEDEWSFPVALPIPQQGVTAPSIIADPFGTVYVAYALPVNEARGIYLTTSANEGLDWQAHELVFDGQAAGWEMVDAPRLALTGSNQLHLLWWRRSLNNAGATPYYARSVDGGSSWSEPEAIAYGNDGVALAQWSDIVGNNAGEVHRFWQVEAEQTVALWHQWSNDNGLSWQSAQQLVGFGETIVGAPAIFMDKRGQPHLIQTVRDSAESDTQLQQWAWQNENWVLVGDDVLDRQTATTQIVSAAVVSADERLVVVYTGQGAGASRPFEALFSTGRDYTQADTIPIPGDIAPQPTNPPAAATAIPLQPTVESRAPDLTAEPPPTGSEYLPTDQPLLNGAVLAIVPAVLVVIVGIAVVSRRKS